jgi:hypothetical protein
VKLLPLLLIALLSACITINVNYGAPRTVEETNTTRGGLMRTAVMSILTVTSSFDLLLYRSRLPDHLRLQDTSGKMRATPCQPPFERSALGIRMISA